MGTTMVFKLTAVQKKALALLSMSLFLFFCTHNKTIDTRPERDETGGNLPFSDNFSNFYFIDEPHYRDSYLYNACVNIAVNILIRNIARADFTIKKRGADVISGPQYELFCRPNFVLSRFDLWKGTATWRRLEGEAFRWFDLAEYTGGLPKELYVLNPHRLHHKGYDNGEVYHSIKNNTRRWFYYAGNKLIPILSEELVRFRDWNPVRGVNPLVSPELEQTHESLFFMRFGLKETGVFDLWNIPMLQDSEDTQSKRGIAKINAGLKTINDVLKERGKDTKPWGDMWYRPKNMIATSEKGYDIP
jgi:hypothetical protein